VACPVLAVAIESPAAITLQVVHDSLGWNIDIDDDVDVRCPHMSGEECPITISARI